MQLQLLSEMACENSSNSIMLMAISLLLTLPKINLNVSKSVLKKSERDWMEKAPTLLEKTTSSHEKFKKKNI